MKQIAKECLMFGAYGMGAAIGFGLIYGTVWLIANKMKGGKK